MVKAIVTDIEGTTTSLCFVKETLFPYARAHLGEFVRSHATDPPVKTLLEDSCKEVGVKLDTEQLIQQLIHWLDEDKKVTPLKSLQGLIWEKGYKQGDFTGHLYQDAAENLKVWKAKGVNLYIYSSGSIYAQKLLFGHTEYGDLTSLFSDYFDTHIGGKKDKESYNKIAQKLVCSPDKLLFLSDLKEELDAAREAGFNTIWLTRGSTPDPQAEHRQINTFDQISLKT
ncbi:Enolase-phosphatase E1 [Candidatus Methylobacter favarea]|uniref:Enolase-phosphatase E1 n=1 Tax=Candidatus Methylobacter favarea TaxID=2707345 RepID=A0A8S0XUS7_9GAMM|nr:acireductone synthase [Candidatus Methylobacter favarea]CAA9892428.1 Enolase-phosphatase E1 [Candidatus Methylobacter favarea]